VPFDLNNTKKEKTHGEFGHSIPNDSEGVCYICPENRIGGVGDAEFPEILTQAMLNSNLNEDCEAEEKDLYISSSVTQARI